GTARTEGGVLGRYAPGSRTRRHDLPGSTAAVTRARRSWAAAPTVIIPSRSPWPQHLDRARGGRYRTLVARKSAASRDGVARGAVPRAPRKGAIPRKRCSGEPELPPRTSIARGEHRRRRRIARSVRPTMTVPRPTPPTR